jgi:hypothetical protein
MILTSLGNIAFSILSLRAALNIPSQISRALCGEEEFGVMMAPYYGVHRKSTEVKKICRYMNSEIFQQFRYSTVQRQWTWKPPHR